MSQNKQKEYKIKGIIVVIGVMIFVAAQAHAAEDVCFVEPGSLTIFQGESANASLILNIKKDVPFELTLGNLPQNVLGGFSKSGIVAGEESQKLALIVQAKTAAQTGSFSIPVLYKLSAGGESSNLICQFNLQVKAKPDAAAPLSIESQIVKVVTLGSLPATFSMSVTNKSLTPSASGITLSLKRGSRGSEIKKLQEILKNLKFFPATEDTTNYFGPITESAVKEFQKSKGIEAIGIVGPKTRAALKLSQ